MQSYFAYLLAAEFGMGAEAADVRSLGLTCSFIAAELALTFVEDTPNAESETDDATMLAALEGLPMLMAAVDGVDGFERIALDEMDVVNVAGVFAET